MHDDGFKYKIDDLHPTNSDILTAKSLHMYEPTLALATSRSDIGHVWYDHVAKFHDISQISEIPRNSHLLAIPEASPRTAGFH